MTQFEYDTTFSALCLLENHLKEDDIRINGKPVDEKRINDTIEKIKVIRVFLSCIDE